MESNLRVIVGIVILVAGAIVWVVYLYESGRFGPRLRKYLRIIPALAVIAFVLYALYRSGTIELLYFYILTFVTVFIIERGINRFRKLTRFGSRLIVLIVVTVVSIWSNLFSVSDSIINGIAYFIASVWYFPDETVKSKKISNI